MLERPLPEDGTNFLGQSPIHLAVGNADIVRLLLRAGCNINATDNWGHTALMYAAAMDCQEAVLLLLSEGANPCMREEEYGRIFLDYALIRGHGTLFLRAMEKLQELYTTQNFQAFVRRSLVLLTRAEIMRFEHETRGALFAQVCRWCKDVNFSFTDHRRGTDGRNLMHDIRNLQEANALVDAGFNAFNAADSKGELAIHRFAEQPDIELFQFCLDHGTDVNHKNHDGLTVLFRVLWGLDGVPSNIPDTLAILRLAFGSGIDICASDDCNCACSPTGCTISSVFDLGFEGSDIFRDSPWFIWFIECVTLVEEFQGLDKAKAVLMGALRRLHTDAWDITHVCCHRGKGISDRKGILGCFGDQVTKLCDEDTADILDEEADFIDGLENDMASLQDRSHGDLRTEFLSLMKKRYEVHKKVCATESARKDATSRRADSGDKSRVCYFYGPLGFLKCIIKIRQGI